MDYTSKFKALKAQRDEYNRTHNEGGEGFNPFDELIEKLAEEWSKENSEKINAILSGESLQAERAWFNAQGFGRKDLQQANAACLERGYSLADLQSAAKAANAN